MLEQGQARGAGGAAAEQLEARLGDEAEVVLPPEEAHALLEELRASGRRWVFGTDAPRPREGPAPAPARPEPEPAPRQPGLLARLWRR